MLWNHRDAERATGGASSAPWEATGVSIDTRTLQAGDLFVALKDRRDGHDFINAAFNSGAAAAMVSRQDPSMAGCGPLLVVRNVQQALEALACHRRSESRCVAIAVTGSVGKTSSKDMLRMTLERQGRVHASARSYNNRWGVPLTLARMPVDTEFLVAEVGMNQPGEIRPLGRIVSPDIGLVTTVGAAHLAGFGNVAEIAAEKAQLFRTLQHPGTAVFNCDIETRSILADTARQHRARMVRFGRSEGADYRLKDIRTVSHSTVIRFNAGSKEHLFRLSAVGEHFAMNALGVLATLDAAGADPIVAALDLRDWQPLEGRGRRHEIVLDSYDEAGRFILVDDAYNSNPASLAAGLTALGNMTAPGNRIAILGDMLELGRNGAEMHADLAGHPAIRHLSRIHCIGPLMRHLHDALPYDKRGFWFEQPELMASRAGRLAGSGDIILVKGSKASGTSLVARALRGLDRDDRQRGMVAG